MPNKRRNNQDKLFGLDNNIINIIILTLTFLSFILIEIVKSAYENTLLPIPIWVNLISFLSFILMVIFLLYIFIYLKHGYFWKIFIVLIFLSLGITLVLNFNYIFPRSYTSYRFTCDLLNNSNLPVINFELENFGRSISINHILLNLSDKGLRIRNENSDVNGNMVYTLTPNEKYNTFFVIELRKNFTGKLIINNKIDCEGFYCYIIGKSPTDKKCEYLFNKGIVQLSKE